MNGTLNPVIMVNVGTQVSGTVRTINADFNQEVKAGQVLAELDPALFRAALGQSSANLANARAQLKLAQAEEARFRSLVEQEYASRQELDRAVAGVRMARVSRNGFSTANRPNGSKGIWARDISSKASMFPLRANATKGPGARIYATAAGNSFGKMATATMASGSTVESVAGVWRF